MLGIDLDGEVGILRLDRPPANALNRDLLLALLKGLGELRDRGAGAVILTGRPGMFSAGLDVPELLGLDRDQVLEFWALFFQLNHALAASEVPVIAAISGHAPAGGAVLALHCDFRIGVEGNYRFGLNEVQVGLPVPPTILLALERVVGPRLARWLAVRGELVPMAQAAALGLIDELVPQDELLAAAGRLAGELLALPAIAMNTTRLATKAVLLDALGRGMDAATATDWWFSDETQAGMRRLVARLSHS